MGSFGPPELLIILFILVLLFGARKLPELARGSGRALRIFKSETKGLTTDDEEESSEQPARPQLTQSQPPAGTVTPPPPTTTSEPTGHTENDR